MMVIRFIAISVILCFMVVVIFDNHLVVFNVVLFEAVITRLIVLMVFDIIRKVFLRIPVIWILMGPYIVFCMGMLQVIWYYTTFASFHIFKCCII